MGLLAAAFLTNFGGIRDIVTNAIGKSSFTFEDFLTVIKNVFEGIKTFVAGAIEFIKMFVGAILEFIKPALERVAAAVGPMIKSFEPVGAKLQKLFGAVVEFIKAAASVIVPIVITVIGGSFNFLLNLIAAFMPVLGTILGAIIDTITNILEFITTLINGIIEVVGKLVKGDFLGAWEDFKIMVNGLITNLIEAFGALLPGIWEAVTAVWDALVKWIGDLVIEIKKLLGISSPSQVFIDIAKDMIHGLINGIVGMADALKNKFREFLEINVTKALDFVTFLKDAGSRIIEGLAQGITDKGKWFYDQFVGWLKTWVHSSILKIMGIESPSRYFMWIGRMLVIGLAEGIRGATPEVVKATTEMISSIIGVLNSVMQFLMAS